MRKINLCYFLFVGVLVSCTNTYDVCEMQRNETEDMSSRMAGDGVYDVLGFGYDITPAIVTGKQIGRAHV